MAQNVLLCVRRTLSLSLSYSLLLSPIECCVRAMKEFRLVKRSRNINLYTVLADAFALISFLSHRHVTLCALLSIVVRTTSYTSTLHYQINAICMNSSKRWIESILSSIIFTVSRCRLSFGKKQNKLYWNRKEIDCLQCTKLNELKWNSSWVKI